MIIDNYITLSQLPGVKIEIVLANDGSTEHVTEAAIEKLRDNIPALQVISYTVNKGKGHALRKGVAAANGTYVIYTDIDFPYTQQSMIALYTALENDGIDIAIGVKNAEYYRHVPASRKFISRLLRSMIRTFLSMPITDTQCGLKGFKAQHKDLFLATTIDRYLFDLEFVRNAFKQLPAGKIAAVPVQLNPDVQFRKMNYKILLPELINFIRVATKKTGKTAG